MQKTTIRVLVGAGMACAVLGMASRPVSLTRPAIQSSGPRLVSTVPPDLPANPTPADAATFAWQSFVAVNWPALAGSRGVADPKKTIGQPGDVVWNTWKAPDEIFYDDGRQPPSWNQFGGVLPTECQSAGASSGEYWLERITKVPGDVNNNAIDLAKEVVGGTLTDQHGNLARFDVRLNQTIFDNIVAKQYYNTQGQDSATAISFPTGVMEVKASWRTMTDADTGLVKSRFYRRDAWVYTPQFGTQPATCVKAEVGLVGLHITHKTASRPQWTWATFEQIDNVPPFNAPPPLGRTLPYSFNNPACPVTQCVPNQSTEQNGIPTTTPTQVTRVVNIGAGAQRANPQWQAALAKAVPGSPFQYYQLVDVQYPQSPKQRPAGNPTPGLLANTTMETYIVESSCLNCHFTARTASGKLSSDYSFMLAEAHARKAAQ